MAETLERVKRHFGPHAVILSTRTVDRSGLLGLRAAPCVEITAAGGVEDLPEALRPGRLGQRSRSAGQADGAANMALQEANNAETPGSEALLSEVGALKSIVADLVRETRHVHLSQGADGLCEAYRKLVQNAVAEGIAQQLVDRLRAELSPDQLGNPLITRQRLAKAVESMLPTSGPIRLRSDGRPTVVALIGPTGVGKTTTIAKLAAHFCLREHRRVGLITIDTYRIAAIEQLRTYAEIIDVPLEVVMSPQELQDAVAGFADRDVVFIDTAGRSQRDAAKNAELQQFFETVRPDEVHLVLAGTSHEAVLVDTVQRFSHLGIDRIIFTKLDEALGFGVMLSCLERAKAKLSYVTTGQDVPDDIRVGEGQALARLILARSPRLNMRRASQTIASESIATAGDTERRGANVKKQRADSRPGPVNSQGRRENSQSRPANLPGCRAKVHGQRGAPCDN